MNKYDELLNKLYALLTKTEGKITKHEDLIKSNQEEIKENTNKLQENKQELDELFHIRKVLTNYTFDLKDLKKKRFWVRALKFILRVLGIGALIFIAGSHFGISLPVSLILALVGKVIFETLKINLSDDIGYILENYNLIDTQDNINKLITENKELEQNLKVKIDLVNTLENKDLTLEKEEVKIIKEDIKLVAEAKNKVLTKFMTEEITKEIDEEFAHDEIIKRVRM